MTTDFSLDDNWHDASIAVRSGQRRSQEGEHSEPIFATSSFVFDSAAEAAARFSGEDKGNIYSRFTNPTVATFERRLAAMEGGEACVATSSGMAAITATCLGLLSAGDHIVASESLFGTAIALFDKYLRRYGIETTFVTLTDLDEWEAAVRPNTKLLFLETPANPLTQIGDIKALAELAHANGAWLAVDNCFCTPVLQKPLELGADLVIHSATKYLDGQGRCIGGAVVGPADLVGEHVLGFLRTAGPTMSPFNAWVFLKGLETLDIRMERICTNAQKLAEWLESQASVSRVYFPGLLSHPQFELAQQQQSGPGGIVTFELKGGQSDAWNLIDSTKMLSITANLGDTRSTITHPATTTHSRLEPKARAKAGITDGIVRIAVGIENIDDIIGDVARGIGA